jgi:hypothetical protein
MNEHGLVTIMPDSLSVGYARAQEKRRRASMLIAAVDILKPGIVKRVDLFAEPLLRPLVKRCACGCGGRISDNKGLKLACRERLSAELLAKKAELAAAADATPAPEI